MNPPEEKVNPKALQYTEGILKYNGIFSSPLRYIIIFSIAGFTWSMIVGMSVFLYLHSSNLRLATASTYAIAGSLIAILEYHIILIKSDTAQYLLTVANRLMNTREYASYEYGMTD